ncbi:hypothetical protein VP96_03027 [Vibrio cholerae]|nr:hypothetical protein VP96_03027 [Vibrio cholerae]
MAYWLDFPLEKQCRLSVRSLLPLRVSSGVTPDSLFSHF